MNLVFTDLDGTLLDLESYDPGPARRAVSDLQAAGYPVVFCSSKTRAEQQAIRNDLGVTGPYIVENGSAIVNPGPPDAGTGAGRDEARSHDSVTVLGRSRSEITSVLTAARRDLGLAFLTYEDLSLNQVAAITGLDRDAAGRAARREYSETILTPFVRSGDVDRLRAFLANHGLHMQCGGRFLTVTGSEADKGAAVRVLHDRLGGRSVHPQTVGIGDSENDTALLAACDRRFLVRRPDGSWFQSPELSGVEFLEGTGPEGWCQMADRLLGDQHQTRT